MPARAFRQGSLLNKLTVMEDDEAPSTSKNIQLPYEPLEDSYMDSPEYVEISEVDPHSPTPSPTPTSSAHKTWFLEPQNVEKIPFTGIPGLTVDTEGNTPIDFLNLFLDDYFFYLVVENTNNNAQPILFESTYEKRKTPSWKHVTKEEFKIFFALLLHMGTIKINRISDYWKTHYLFNIPVFGNFMSRPRFLLILKELHFGNTVENSQNRSTKVSPLIDYFNTRMEQIYYPQKELALSHSTFPQSSRVDSKRNKFGVKLFVLSEPTGMVQKILVQEGSSPTTSKWIINEMLKGKTGVGHSLYMDNFFNTVGLSEELLATKTYVTGTLRINRRDNPKEMASTTLKRGESFCQYTKNGVCVCKWNDGKEVMAISTEFDGEMVAVTNLRGIERTKPKIIAEYNKIVDMVEQTEQMINYYSWERKTLRWYKELAVHIFQVMLLNSHFLYNMYVGKKMSFYDFRLCVLESLLPPPPKLVEQPLVNHLPEYCPKDNKGKARRRRCKYCWEAYNKRKDSVYFCPKCPNEPGLCLSCFRSFHEN